MIDFKLHSLGWHSFQQLCLTICREILGQTVESYLDTNDGGRDGGFAGTWNPNGLEDLTGKFVIQCKFTSKQSFNLSVSDLGDEFEKAKRLVAEDRCDTYLLITNAGISGKKAEAIEAAYQAVGVKHIRLFGFPWLRDQILENKRLRMLVPRVYGLGDLSQILDERAYSQARALLDSMSEDLSKIVLTTTYEQAAHALNEHGFVLLIGEPAAGKTTIASLLAVSAIDQWQASPMKLDDPGTVIEHWNPDEPSQLFWVDDAFGVTQYESHLVLGWNRVIPKIKAMLKQGIKIVMTSRDYIYNRARKELKESAFPLLRESQVVIDVHALSPSEKRQILYNHLKLGTQPTSFRSKIKTHLQGVADHNRFVPEVARRLADPVFTRDLKIAKYSLNKFVGSQETFLQDLLEGLDGDNKAALALIHMRKDSLESPIHLGDAEKQAVERLESSLGGCTSALESLKGSLVRIDATSDSRFWKFKHPTIGDAYAVLLSKNSELLEIFIEGSTTEKLLYQVTCGDVGYENAVVLGTGLFPSVLAKLAEYSTDSNYKDTGHSKRKAKRDILNFLARRCSKTFLESYIQNNPNLIGEVSRPGLMLYAMSELNVALKLREYGLLPEEARVTLIKTVSNYAVEGQDIYALSNEALRAVFNEEELEALLTGLHDDLVPRLDDVRMDYEWGYDKDSEDSAEDHIQPFQDVLDVLVDEFNDKLIEQQVVYQRKHIQDWIDEQEEQEEPEELTPRAGSLSNAGGEVNQEGERSIFEDVDE